MRARESACFRGDLRCGRVRGSSRHARAVLRRAQALQRGAIGGYGRSEARRNLGVRGPSARPDVAVVQPNVLPVSINRRVSIEVSGQWLFGERAALERY